MDSEGVCVWTGCVFVGEGGGVGRSGRANTCSSVAKQLGSNHCSFLLACCCCRLGLLCASLHLHELINEPKGMSHATRFYPLTTIELLNRPIENTKI